MSNLIANLQIQSGDEANLYSCCPFKGCGMGPWLVLVSPCFRENVVDTCKIRSFLCSLDNLPQKNVNVLFFGNQISKWHSFEKMVIFDLLFTFSSHQGKLQKFLQHISHSYFAHPITFLFCLTKFEKNTNLSGTVSLWHESWYWFLFAPFRNNQWTTKWCAKFKLECLLLICTYTNEKFIVICKPRTLNDAGEDSVKYRNRKKHQFLAAAILLFIG